MSKGVSLGKEKAKEILRHGEVKGHVLTEKQKGFFGARAGGKKMPHGGLKGKFDKKGRPNKHASKKGRVRIQPPVPRGAPLLKPKNAPLFKGPSDPSEGGMGTDRWKEPLDLPGASVLGAGVLTNLKGLHQNQAGQDPTVKDVPFPAAIQDSDFHQGGFSKGTGRFLKTGGMA